MQVALSARSGWGDGVQYLKQGLDITRRQPWLYLQLVLVYSLPSLAAAWLVLYGPYELIWYQPLVFALPWITVAVAPSVLMHAVDAGHRGEKVNIFQASGRGIPRVPLYVWTNVHTTAMFWIPVGGLILLRATGPGHMVPDAVWFLAIGVVALHQHVRTMLAPYLAIHGELGGTRAALHSWRLGGRHFWSLLATFLVSVAPVGVPLAVFYLLLEFFGPKPLSAALLAASAQIGWVVVQAIRPVLIPSLHSLYEDLVQAGVIPS